MKKISIIVIFLLYISACTRINEQKNIKLEKYTPLKTSQQIFDSLHSAITGSDERALRRVFNEWQASFQPNSEEQTSKYEVTSEIFDLFLNFYGPTSKIFYEKEKSEYYIIQNKLKYGITESRNLKNIDPETFKLDTISNFRPRVNIDVSKVLYLTPEYNNAFQTFLNMRDSLTLKHKVMQDKKQFNMLTKLCPIKSNMVNHKYSLSIDPYISSIIFSRNLRKARVDCMIQNHIGYALIFIKKGNKWIVKDSFETWIV
ncbi:hypothetical protein [Marinifilum fragile]|uniref:hypothetical protein n=1 Tax=Marinifilum fragile TaxID=570161 RepID=UPI002AA6355E|nr:hypothetical protein [Marinifilum fragile]